MFQKYKYSVLEYLKCETSKIKTKAQLHGCCFAFCILSCCGCERWMSRNLLHLELDLWYRVLVMRVHLTEKEYTRKRTKIGQFYKISERSLDSTRNITISRLVFFVRGCAKNYCPLEVSHVTLLPGNKTVDISNSLQSSCL